MNVANITHPNKIHIIKLLFKEENCHENEINRMYLKPRDINLCTDATFTLQSRIIIMTIA